MSVLGRTRQLDRYRADGCFRRVSPVAARFSEGRFTQATAATQAWRPEPLFMPEGV